MPVNSSKSEHFRADAAVVWRLGAELFTSSDQALVELIKNAYDADARHVRLTIQSPRPVSSTDGSEPAGEDLPAGAADEGPGAAGTDAHRGSIVIADDGVGMTDTDIVRGWLTLSASIKAEQKERGIPPDKRVPLGDKGLGRLGAQRLGRNLRLRTRPRVPKGGFLEHDVTIDWGEFQRGRLLEEIIPEWVPHTDSASAEPWPLKGRTGTVLEITEPYSDDAGWADETTLQRSLSTVMNPYSEIQDFDVAVELDGEPVDLKEVSQEVREAALASWHVSYGDGELQISGRLRREWFRPREEERRELLQRQLRSSDGRSELVRRLRARGPVSDVSFTQGKGQSFTVKHTVCLDDRSGFPQGESGPFHMELDVVPLELAVARELSLSVFDRQAEYRRWITERGGVSIFRDGFVVAGGDDLLRLGTSFTSGGSYYGLRPQNVLGYIGISARENPQLAETTSREDFQRNAAFLRLEAIVQLAVQEINRILDESGRAGSEWARELSERAQGMFGLTSGEIVDQAGTVAERSRAAAASVQRAEAVLSSVEVLDDETDADRAELLRDLATARSTLESATELTGLVSNLRDRIEQAQLNYDDLLATAGLGLAAEGLAHDITQVMERLRTRARAAAKAREGLPLDVELLLDEVDWASGALRAQLRHLDPMLRYSRLRRTEVNLGKLVKDTAQFHRDRLHPQGIAVTVSVSSPSRVRLSPGRLGQALDNLVHNSTYWLSDDERADSEPAAISFTVDGSEILVADNGPGVPEDLGVRAFEPFVTRKHEGRGLGLWLVRQLLDLDQASIDLERDPDTGRLNRFRIRYPDVGDA
jgi:signal transduction histidine kinase